MQPIDTGTMTILILIALSIGLIVGAAGGAAGARLTGQPAWKGAAVPLLSVLLPIPFLFLVRAPGPLEAMLLQLVAAVLAGFCLKLGPRGTAGSIIGAIVAVGVLVIGASLWNGLVN
ncbi:hypothetical protein [Peteryoungia ipomoeae]|uniref:Uncharacterized protein n=1 Tax=Peteryoungia ipomoeae TaxID=1210932 RepID=A0A4S8NZ37_9HYPH|nr:hypothetical protein [Peteryoungia ipomoeae]THV22960.1 hypothetical protein FAA97_10010 [Peteryoungia ipomoeae]